MMSVGYRKEQVLNRLSRLEENCTLRVTMLGFEILNGEQCNDLNKKYLKVKVRANNKDIFNQTIPGQIKELPICRTVWAVFGKSHWQMNVTMSQKVEIEKGSATSTCHVPCELCLERLTGRRREDSWGQCAFAVAPKPVFVFLYLHFMCYSWKGYLTFVVAPNSVIVSSLFENLYLAFLFDVFRKNCGIAESRRDREW